MGGRSLEGTRNDRNADDDDDGGGIPTRRMEEVGGWKSGAYYPTHRHESVEQSEPGTR